MLKLACSFFILFSSAFSFTYCSEMQMAVKEKMITNLDIIKNTFEYGYAPAQWKKAFTDWDLDREINGAKYKILAKPEINIKDYQIILADFFKSTKDHHVRISFYSTEMACLPFRLISAQGHYFVDWVSNSFFAEFQESLKKGDEVLFLNDIPINEVVEEVKSSLFSKPFSATDQTLAEAAVTMRIGAMGIHVPKGDVAVTVRDGITKKRSTYSLQWLYHPEEINNSLDHLETPKKIQSSLVESPLFDKSMITPIYEIFKDAEERRDHNLAVYHRNKNTKSPDEEDRLLLGGKRSCVPILGEITWEAPADYPFYAYMYKDQNNRMIGYVRIPHYKYNDIKNNKPLEAFGEIIKLFEANTEAMIIDQINNPGGNVFYINCILSMLTDRPLALPPERETISQENVFYAYEDLHQIEEAETDEEALELFEDFMEFVDLESLNNYAKYCRFIINEWNEGRRLTNPGYLFGMENVKPHPSNHYSKPILVLVNELAFSGGDFVPAILQDNKRATILGTKTAGAGGYVLRHSYRNLFGIKEFRYTGSIAYRMDKNPIENLGVTPDIIVERSKNDLLNNYGDYVNCIHKAMNDILNHGTS